MEIGHPVFERLKTADRPAELHPFLAVIDSQLQAAGGGADLFGGQQDRGDISDAGIGAQRCGALRRNTSEPPGGVHGGDAAGR